MEESIHENDIRKILKVERGAVDGISLSYRVILWAPKVMKKPYLKFKVAEEKQKKNKQKMNAC